MGSDPGRGLYVFVVYIGTKWTGRDGSFVTEWLREHPYDPDTSELRS